VERYLATRGIAVGQASVPAREPAPNPKSTVISDIAAEVVDKFLSRRGGSESGGGFS